MRFTKTGRYSWFGRGEDGSQVTVTRDRVVIVRPGEPEPIITSTGVLVDPSVSSRSYLGIVRDTVSDAIRFDEANKAREADAALWAEARRAERERAEARATSEAERRALLREVDEAFRQTKPQPPQRSRPTAPAGPSGRPLRSPFKVEGDTLADAVLATVLDLQQTPGLSNGRVSVASAVSIDGGGRPVDLPASLFADDDEDRIERAVKRLGLKSGAWRIYVTSMYGLPKS